MMDPTSLRRMFPGTFNFFHPDPEEMRLAIPGAEAVLPTPQRIFLDSEEATPFMGFPVLMSDSSGALRECLEAYLQADVEMQVAAAKRVRNDPKLLEAAWQRYGVLLDRNTENAVRSSFGRRLPSVFWLYHSIAVSRLFKEMPRRIRRIDLEIGRSQV